jgi:hypothetical protein
VASGGPQPDPCLRALNAELKAGQSLVVDGGPAAHVYDAKGRQTAMIALARPAPRLPSGRLTVLFDCVFAGDAPPAVDLPFGMRGKRPAERKKRRSAAA